MKDLILVIGLLGFFVLAIFGLIWAVRNLIYQTKVKKRANVLEEGFENSDINIFVAFTNHKTKEIEKIVKNNLSSSAEVESDYSDEQTDIDPRDDMYKYPTIQSFNVSLKPDLNNEYDKNAIKVLVDDVEVGFIPKKELSMVKSNFKNTLYKAIISEGIIKPEYKEKGQDEQFKIILIGTDK